VGCVEGGEWGGCSDGWGDGRVEGLEFFFAAVGGELGGVEEGLDPFLGLDFAFC
jgi:hypothetical protein